MAAAWADVSTDMVDAAQAETVRVRAGLVDDFGELVGSEVLPEVELIGGVYVEAPGVSTGGAWVADIAPAPGASEITIALSAQGVTFGEFAVAVLNPADGPDDPGPRTPGGCAACGAALPGGSRGHGVLLWTVALLGLAIRSRQ